MSKVYTVVTYRSVSNPAALVAYAELAGPAIRAAGGRVIARGMPLMTFEAGLTQRVVLVEWDDVEHAAAVYQSDAYRKALVALGGMAERDIRIVPRHPSCDFRVFLEIGWLAAFRASGGIPRSFSLPLIKEKGRLGTAFSPSCLSEIKHVHTDDGVR